MTGEARKILLVRTSAMGDIVHSLPTLGAVRERIPDAEIGWVVEQQFAPLLADHARIDHLFTVRTRAWRRMPRWQALQDLRRAIQPIRAFRADIAVDLMGNHKGAILARLSGARRVVGATRRSRREPSSAWWIRQQVSIGGEHAIDRALSLVAALGTPADGENPPGAVDLGGADLLPAAQPPTNQEPYAVIQVGAGWGNKQYPTAWWGLIARRLEDAGLAVKIPIAPGEEDLARAVVEASGGAAEAVDAVAFDALVALLRGACVAIGGDTGPIHLAHALGTRVVCVMGPTDPRRHGPYGATDDAMWHQLPCSFCYKRMSGTRACLLAIPPERIAAHAQSLANI